MTATLTETGFRVESKAFAQATAWAAKHLPSRLTQPVMAGMLLEYSAGTLRVSAFDWDTAATAELETDAGGAGRVVVSGRRLAALAATLPDKPLAAQIEGSKLVITCGSVRFSAPTMTLEDYPTLPAAPQAVGHVDARAFARAVERAGVAADRDGSSKRPPMLGLHLTLSADNIRLIGSDGYRIAVDQLPWAAVDRDASDREALVPATVLLTVAKAYADAGSVDIAVDHNLAAFTAGGLTTVTRLMAASDVHAKLLGHPGFAPVNDPVRVDTADLATVLKRALTLRDAKTLTPVRITVTDEVASIETIHENETIQDAVACQYAGQEITFAADPSLLLDALGALHSEVAEIHLTQPRRPLLLVNPEDAHYRHVMMPIRLS